MTEAPNTTAAEALAYAQAIDTEFAALDAEAAKLRQQRAYALDALHRAAGDERPRIEQKNKRTGQWNGYYDDGPWGLTDEEARDQVSLREGGYHGERHTAALERVDKTEDALGVVLGRMFALRRIYGKHRWSRFFLVKNHGGHIHSSMACSTCYDTTEFGWLPQLSGLDEAAAVAAHGAILCTICFPSAPTEWTDGRKAGDDQVCSGSGSHAPEGWRRARYCHCLECDQAISVTSNGKLRKHKLPEAS